MYFWWVVAAKIHECISVALSNVCTLCNHFASIPNDIAGHKSSFQVSATTELFVCSRDTQHPHVVNDAIIVVIEREKEEETNFFFHFVR